MSAILLRTMTRKSKFKIGKWCDYTIQELLDLRKGLQLIQTYYKYDTINYTEDILKELKITGEFVIPKPSKDLDKYYEFLNSRGYQKPIPQTRDGINKLKKKPRISKTKLQAKNHGR